MAKKEKKEQYMSSAMRTFRNQIVKIIPEQSPLFRIMCLTAFRITAKKKHKLREVMKIDIPVVEHCNLCCKGCTAFAPLAQEEFLDVEQYGRDMEKLAKLTNHNLTAIMYTGGEPLLHPRFGEMMIIARRLFPNAEIGFMTNGTLIPKQTDEFWQTCADNCVTVSISKYPIKLDKNKIAQIKEQWGVTFDWVGGEDVPVKKMWKYPLALNGGVKQKDSFDICNQVNSCIRMKNGRIYPCNKTACVEHFNRYFHTNMELVPDKDYIQLDKVQDIHEIYEFLITPPPFCRYCNRAGVTFGYDWAVSKKDITEWS